MVTDKSIPVCFSVHALKCNFSLYRNTEVFDYMFAYTRENSFSKTSFHLRIDGAEKRVGNKAEMKERKKTARHLL